LNLKNTSTKLLKLIKRKFSKGCRTSLGKVFRIEINGVPIKSQGLELGYMTVDEATIFSEKELEALLKKKGYSKGWGLIQKEKMKINPKALKHIRGKFLKEKKQNGD